ncbi:hypothetical protein [Caldicellulosiruptor danielii]|uniref:Uncharacterized protein n=1 Tax=Anaerocellum danielii TaxID=1387557 RepID=A0ABZ0U293_9FIRM|nr:hypothetical protein [Caldicellulosiruptor danielii]WPX09212.1 hypothetical protein SOJ16_000403 [Caldicellulosiruptor danielii]
MIFFNLLSWKSKKLESTGIGNKRVGNFLLHYSFKLQPVVLSKDWNNELPELIKTIIQVAMSPDQEKIYKQFLVSAKEKIEKEIDAVGFEKKPNKNTFVINKTETDLLPSEACL